MFVVWDERELRLKRERERERERELRGEILCMRED